MLTCHKCESQTDKPRLPRGWKRLGDAAYCAKCWKSQYTVRAVTLPIAGPVSGDWKEFRAALSSCWGASTSVANWAFTQLAKSDIVRTADMEKLPPMPKIYLYGMRDQCFAWDAMGSAQAANSVVQQTEAKYRAARYGIVWTGEQTLPTARYPQPYPVHNASWSAEQTEGGQILVSCRLAGERWTFRLKSGGRYHRQTAGLLHLISNPDLRGELSLYRQRAAGPHESRENGNGAQIRFDIMCKVVGWFPIQERASDGTLWVSTSAEGLLTAVNAKDEKLWQYHADHVQRLTMQRRAKLQRFSDDTKAERRRPRRESERFRDHVAEYCRRNRNALTTVCHQTTASLVNYATRRRFARIVYNDSCHDFCHEFPWHQLRTMAEQKCRASGVVFELASAKATKKSPAVLAEE